METHFLYIFIFVYLLFKSYYVVWKRSERVEVSACRCEFKSYYVVWKLFFHFALINAIVCLNRTMQYGNDFCFFFFLRENFAQFKSYYVVWKRSKFNLEHIVFFEFKSYYVVWKLILFVILEHTSIRLNRTMQYGNFYSYFKSFLVANEFKSYYEVWKLVAFEE